MTPITTSPETAEQVGGYLKILIERYRMIERRLPVFAKPKARRNRYYVRDNFLRSWLGALSNAAAAIQFRPIEALLQQADDRLMELEGHGLERLAAQLYEERSRKKLGFPLTSAIQGYWDRGDVELDLVALNEEDRVLRVATCKRAAERVLPDLEVFEGHVARFLDTERRFEGWRIERAAIAPRFDAATRATLAARGVQAEDIGDLTAGM